MTKFGCRRAKQEMRGRQKISPIQIFDHDWYAIPFLDNFASIFDLFLSILTICFLSDFLFIFPFVSILNQPQRSVAGFPITYVNPICPFVRKKGLCIIF